MKTVCCVCGYEYDGEKPGRCPRCGSAPRIMGGCENCRGCSLWRSCELRDTDKAQHDAGKKAVKYSTGGKADGGAPEA
ncbi:MAG: hypothetical protein GX940_00015 [Clostridiaceae bacterium]|nr:hypothetical protein [Clostridiaceae bacterium]